ncbi:hypothetical protein E8E15_008313 [Penicillium rubens]|nr:hypothetical protein E8E15_008313 [Penicillium rubens]
MLDPRTGEHVDVNSLNLVRAISDTGKPTVVVFSSGKPITEPWIANSTAAFVQSFYPSEQGGNTLADVLFGQLQSLWSTICHAIEDSGHVDANGTIVFGHQYAAAMVSLRIRVDVTNTSPVDGTEVVQLYIVDTITSVDVPNRKLKAFKKLYIKAGETATRVSVPTDYVSQCGEFHTSFGPPTLLPVILEMEQEIDPQARDSPKITSESDHDQYPEGGLKAWSVVLGAWCAMIPSMGLLNSLGTLQPWTSTHQLKDYSESSIGWIYGAYTFFLYLGGVRFVRTRLPFKKAGPSLDFRALRDIKYASATLSVFLVEFAVFIPITYITSYTLHAGFDEQMSYAVLVFLNLGAVFGRFLPGLVADRLGRFNVMIMSSFICSLFTLTLWLSADLVEPHSLGMVISYAVLFGFWSGTAISLAPVCISQVCEIQDYGKRVGTTWTIVSVGTLIAIPIAGAIQQHNNGEYYGLIIFGGVLYISSTIAFIVSRGICKGWALKIKF